MSNHDLYQRYREVGQQLHNKILNEYSDRELILNSAEALGIEHDGRNILYDFQSDMTVHYEYMLYEYRWDGKTAAERYYENESSETDVERTILEATLEAETSLFEITETSEADNRLVVTDLLADGIEHSVLDINLSTTAEAGVLLVFRPIQYEAFTMTSGISFPFPDEKREWVLDEYESQVTQSAQQLSSMQRYVSFYEMYREHGIRMSYA